MASRDDRQGWKSCMGPALGRWCLLIPLLAVSVGTLVAWFLLLLDAVTLYRLHHPQLMYGLPLCGAFIVYSYQKWGCDSERGNDLLIEHLNGGTTPVTAHMGPMIFLSTLLTHLFGGSAGREGSAVQIGGSLGHTIALSFKLPPASRQTLMIAGMAAGFGAVFGTPWTGAIFAIEVLAIGGLRFGAYPLALAASLIADWICRLWSVHHTDYRIASLPPALRIQSLDGLILLKLLFAAALFGLCSRFFAELTHAFKKLWRKVSRRPSLRAILGGCLLVILCLALGNQDYLGLGVSNPDPLAPSIIKAFKANEMTNWSWLWKLIFTAITLSAGFKGGEATPLFFIGACLGAALAPVLGLPIDLLAGLGFVAVFAAACNTRWAGTIMGVEIFGAEFFLYFLIVCSTAYLFSGHSGIYRTQPVARRKYPLWMNIRH